MSAELNGRQHFTASGQPLGLRRHLAGHEEIAFGTESGKVYRKPYYKAGLLVTWSAWLDYYN